MYEKRKDCPDVEQLIWDSVVKKHGNFHGVRSLAVPELWGLAKACKDQIARMEHNKRKEEMTDNE